MIKSSEIDFKGDDPPIGERVFRERGEGRFSLEVVSAGISFEVERLRRHSHELWGELAVKVNGKFPNAKTTDGLLVLGDFNFSSVQARSTRGKLLAERSGTARIDWYGFLEEFSVKVISADRFGSNDINLQMVPKPQPDRMFGIDGVELPLKHPMILFGDGGTAKSYLSMYWAGRMMQQGHKVLYADWEFTPDEHRERLEYLFGPDFPAVRYLSCYRKFGDECERIKRVIRLHGINYLICDSIGLACGGDPSTTEPATSYFQALRALGEIGSLHIAHVTKGTQGGEDQKPFGSAFWHNMARVTMNIKAEQLNDGKLALALFPRKRNLKGRGQSVAYTVEFGENKTVIASSDVKEHEALAEGLPLPDRLLDALKYGSKTRRELSDVLNVDYGLLQRTIHRELKKGRVISIAGIRKGTERITLSKVP